MMRRVLPLLAVCLASAAPALPTADFDSIKARIFDRSCRKCHGRKPLIDRVPLHDYDGLLRSPLELVQPGNPEESGLYLSLTRTDKKRMPPPTAKVPPVTAEEIAVVRDWIQRGAPRGSSNDAAGGESRRSSYPPANPPKKPVAIDPPEAYRKLLLSLRRNGQFRLPLPGGAEIPVEYRLGWGKAKEEKPHVMDLHAHFTAEPSNFLRQFFDRVFTDDDSVLKVGNEEELPITCVYVSGKDNRYGGKLPLNFFDIVMAVYIVANDYTCTGPVNHDPSVGRLGDTWETYLYYQVHDTTTMMPVEIKLRYRKNDYYLVKGRPR